MAKVEGLPPQNEILRETLQQLVTVSGQLQGSNLGGAMVQVKQAVANLNTPSSVRVEYGGIYQEQQKSFADLARMLILALALLFAVLLAEFHNLSAPIAILTNFVLSITGVVVALLITGTDFNVDGAGARDAMLHAAQRRLRPIITPVVYFLLTSNRKPKVEEYPL